MEVYQQCTGVNPRDIRTQKKSGLTQQPKPRTKPLVWGFLSWGKDVSYIVKELVKSISEQRDGADGERHGQNA